MRLWDVGAAACTDTFNHNKAVYCVAAAPGGDGLVAFGGAEKALRVSKEVARAGAHLLGAGAIVAGPQEQAFTVAQGPPASGGIAVELWRCLCHRVSLRGCRLCAARRCCACPRPCCLPAAPHRVPLAGMGPTAARRRGPGSAGMQLPHRLDLRHCLAPQLRWAQPAHTCPHKHTKIGIQGWRDAHTVGLTSLRQRQFRLALPWLAPRHCWGCSLRLALPIKKSALAVSGFPMLQPTT